MSEAKQEQCKDRYPYPATWRSLSKQQQRRVVAEANRRKVAIPSILKRDFVKS